MNYRENKIEENYLSKEFVSLEDQNEKPATQEQADAEIKLLREALFNYFREVDTEDLGVVSFNECVNVFKNMGFLLTPEQWKELMKMADDDANGIIEYKEFVALGAEVIHAIFVKNQAIHELRLKEEGNYAA